MRDEHNQFASLRTSWVSQAMVSHFVSYLPQPTRPAKIHQDPCWWPTSLRKGRGHVAASLGVKGPRFKEKD